MSVKKWRKWKICIAAVLLIAVLVSVNRLCFANFDSTAGFRLAEKTAQKEIAKLYPNLDLTEAEADVSCSVQTHYCFRLRGEIQVLYFWEESGNSISVSLNGYLPIWARLIIIRTTPLQ